ncbi:MAG: RagB/SusD family nutrient uptake outer membrane protein [Duncaniella sp.]|nr:RagB/SusD family nutrient uptake outer membrane protein [Duncaniella sp.]
MKLNINKFMLACGLGASLMSMPSCTLDEVNYGGDTLENLGTGPAGFEQLLNNCYFGMIRRYYNHEGCMPLMEGSTDLWTVAANERNKDNQLFKFYGDASPDVSYTSGFWDCSFDGIGACNMALKTVGTCSFSSEAERRHKEGIARFMRAVYYYNLVEMFGAVPMLTTVGEITYSPERTAPVEIYRQLIIPDLEFAAANIYVGDYSANTTPTRKSALGMLTKACLASRQYTDEFMQRGFEVAKDLIADCEGGGSRYMTYMYPEYADVFKEENSHDNKEALWKYWLSAEANNFYGSSNGAQKLNQNDERFQCKLFRFGAFLKNADFCTAWGGDLEGNMMPTRHLLNLFVQEDGSLDPRFHKSFNTEWISNQDYNWTEGDVNQYKKDAALTGTTIKSGDLGLRFVMPQDENYAAEVAGRGTSNYILVDYKDVYDDAKNDIIMDAANGGENMFRYYYPSLNKHNSSNYYVRNASKIQLGNMNGILVMRMAEVYLIAAEYDILLNGGGRAMEYINKVRSRAGAKPLTGAATIRTVLDERGRELCGEFTRFYDLKRTGMLNDASYLQATHPDLAQYFKKEYALRPIPRSFLDVIANGATFQNPGY